MIYLDIESIECDLNVAAERALVDWYNNNRTMTKQVVLMGYFAVMAGMNSYCDQYVARNRKDTLKTKCEWLDKQLAKAAEKIAKFEHAAAQNLSTMLERERVTHAATTQAH